MESNIEDGYASETMNEKRSRKLDYWVGVPLCFALSVWRFMVERIVGRGVTEHRPQRILFVKLAEMGAIVLTVPAFEAAAKRVGKENLFCLMLNANRDIHELLGIFPRDHVLTIRDDHLLTFVVDAWRMMRFCRREGIDTVIDIEGFTRISAILSYLTGARTRVGFHRHTTEGPYRGDLFTHRVTNNVYHHASLQFLTMVEALELDPDDLPLAKVSVQLDDYRLPVYRPTSEDEAAVDAMLARCGGSVPTGPMILLNCNLVDLLPLRQWPREHFVALATRLLDEHPDATLVLTGLATERDASRALVEELASDRVMSVAGETSLRELVTLFTKADLLITSDCGTGHMAALSDIPIVSLYGPETPALYAPLTPHNESLWLGLACSPCLNAMNHRRSGCRDNVCMRRIAVDAVYAAALRQCEALSACASR